MSARLGDSPGVAEVTSRCRATMHAAEIAYGQALKSSYETYMSATSDSLHERSVDLEQWERHVGRWRVAEKNMTEARNAVRRDLADTLRGDPFGAWVFENVVDEYPNEAYTVLLALPATFNHLNGIARGHRWCEEWRRYVHRAVEAGVVPAEDVPW